MGNSRGWWRSCSGCVESEDGHLIGDYRLIAIEAPPRVQDALMGHAVGEIEYGAGPSLEQRAAWLARVWG